MGPIRAVIRRFDNTSGKTYETITCYHFDTSVVVFFAPWPKSETDEQGIHLLS